MLYFTKFLFLARLVYCRLSCKKNTAQQEKKTVMQGAMVNQRLFKVLVGLLIGVMFPVNAVQPLPVEQVFQPTTRQLDSKTIAVHWAIKPGYYLYRERIYFQTGQAKIQSVVLPRGVPKQNKFLGKYQIYSKEVTILLKFVKPLQNNLSLTINYQGCAVAGFCYPPIAKTFTLSFHKKIKGGAKERKPMSANEQGKAMQLLARHNIWLILLGFFSFGLLLSLTPCVLPLIPVLSAIILGQKQLTTLKAFTLALTYVFAMALTYALAGVFAGLAGSYLQAFLQSSWVVIFVSLIFVLLAFSLFGFYELRLPASWQEKLTTITNHQQGGNYLGVAFMGCLSTLVISPCITAPLVGVLTYIGNTGNAVLGGFALFILGLGSGVPLLIIGTSAGRWLPKSGPWMNGVKIILGMMMLIMAGWLVLRIVPIDSQSFQLFRANQTSVPVKGTFQAVKGIPELNQALIKAKQENKPVLLDFYANWCISCKEMEHTVFSVPQVKTLLSHFIVLRADVTANDALDKDLEKRFNVIAPPTFLFFTSDGQEISNERIVGQMGAQAFASYLHRVLALKKNNST